MGEPRAITYKEVERAGGNAETWAKIGKITGAGEVPRDGDGNASIDITSLSDSKVASIDALLGSAKKESEDTQKKTKA